MTGCRPQVLGCLGYATFGALLCSCATTHDVSVSVTDLPASIREPKPIPNINIPVRVEPFLVDRDTIAALEAAVKMPDGASSLNSDIRYYAGVRLAGERTVQGVMFSPRLARAWQPGVEPTPGAYILSFDQLPKTAGGRCEHIQLQFRLDTGDFVVGCSGMPR